MSATEHFDWNAEHLATLTAMWHAGDTVYAIGAVLGCSKNAVVGKAHRLKLPGRPSPIVRGVARKPPPPRKGRVATLPPLATQSAPVAAPRPAIAAPPLPRPVPVASRTRLPCCWPIGTPRTPDFRFCDAPVADGGSYCVAHRAVAYTKAPPLVLRAVA